MTTKTTLFIWRLPKTKQFLWKSLTFYVFIAKLSWYCELISIHDRKLWWKIGKICHFRCVVPWCSQVVIMWPNKFEYETFWHIKDGQSQFSDKKSLFENFVFYGSQPESPLLLNCFIWAALVSLDRQNSTRDL